MKFCARCNQTFDDSIGFCTSCGGPLGIMPQQPQMPQQMPQQMQGQYPQQMQGQYPQQMQGQYGGYMPQKKPINKLAIIIPIVAVVVIGVTFLILGLTGVLGGGDKNNSGASGSHNNNGGYGYGDYGYGGGGYDYGYGGGGYDYGYGGGGYDDFDFDLGDLLGGLGDLL